jgi:hypothetical protein
MFRVSMRGEEDRRRDGERVRRRSVEGGRRVGEDDS